MNSAWLCGFAASSAMAGGLGGCERHWTHRERELTAKKLNGKVQLFNSPWKPLASYFLRGSQVVLGNDA